MTLDCGTIDDSVKRSARQTREVDMLTRRIQQAHPDVRLTTLTALVEQAYSELAESRVQSFRSILTERVVRLRLEDPTLILNVDEGRTSRSDATGHEPRRQVNAPMAAVSSGH